MAAATSTSPRTLRQLRAQLRATAAQLDATAVLLRPAVSLQPLVTAPSGPRYDGLPAPR